MLEEQMEKKDLIRTNRNIPLKILNRDIILIETYSQIRHTLHALVRIKETCFIANLMLVCQNSHKTRMPRLTFSNVMKQPKPFNNKNALLWINFIFHHPFLIPQKNLIMNQSEKNC